MDRINLPFFYDLGIKLHPLCELGLDPWEPNRLVMPMFGALSATRKLLDDFPTLVVCRTTGEELCKGILDSVRILVKFMTEPQSEPTWEDRNQIVQIIEKAKKFETVLAEELATLISYQVAQKGIYWVPDLIDKAEDAFPTSVKSKLSPETIGEIRQSGRCLALDTPTASGFHMLRATELVLHDYFLAICKPESPKKLDSWGAYLAALRAICDKDDPGVNKEIKEEVIKVLSILQQIKDQDRNLITHPETVLSEDDAQELFVTAQSAIMAMAHQLSETESNGETQEARP